MTAAAADVHVGNDLVPVRRALISVSDKTGLAEFAKTLVTEFGVDLISTGGTAKFLRDAGMKVTDVSEVTGFPEMMDGRVKTLHPKIHGGLLALRDHPEHAAAMKAHDIHPIDLVVINLYPFKKTIEKPGVTFEEAIENIDIGGPSMVRSAAKNHRYVLVVTSPDRYEKVLGDMRKHNGASCAQHRLKQAQRAFAHSAEYDGLIAGYLEEVIDGSTESNVASSTGGGTALFAQKPISGAVATAATALPLPESQSKMLVKLMKNDGPLPSFMSDLLTWQATAAEGTEAAGFTLERTNEHQGSLRLIAHIRPDESSAEIRANAIRAFQDLVKPCVEQGRDGAMEVSAGVGTKGAQYCLVTLLRSENEVLAVSAVITRCWNQEEAQQRLIRLQLIGRNIEHFVGRQSGIGLARLLVDQDGHSGLPQTIKTTLRKISDLRYGENPHQRAALYVDRTTHEASVATAKQHHGKELSYINLLDADAALNGVKEFFSPAACIVKHATPCGYAVAKDLPTAFKNAFAGDPVAAFGGIVALNEEVDLATAHAITSIDKLLEVIVAPGYAADALELLKTRWKNVRLLEVGPVTTEFDRSELMLHKIVGGYLVQERDLIGVDEASWKVVSTRQPTEQEKIDLKMAWLAAKHVKSNAIALAKGGMMLGSGAGQQDRVNACRIAIAKAGERAAGSAAGSDAFFPFPDGPELLLDAGVTAIIQPGGSVKDQATIDLVNQRGATMIFTGQRHFRH